MLERYFIPLAPYALLAATAIAGLVYFACLERELRRLKSGLRRSREPAPAASAALHAKLEDLSARLRDAEERGVLAVPEPRRVGLNLSKRFQVIRMSRRGAATENIAVSLSIPRREVELLLKVYSLGLRGPKEPGREVS